MGIKRLLKEVERMFDVEIRKNLNNLEFKVKNRKKRSRNLRLLITQFKSLPTIILI